MSLPEVYVALREGNLYVVPVKGVVDDFLDACREAELLFDKPR